MRCLPSSSAISRSASIRVQRPAQFLVLTRSEFHDMSRKNPRLALLLVTKIARTLSERMRKTSGQLVDLIDGDDEAPAGGRRRAGRGGEASDGAARV